MEDNEALDSDTTNDGGDIVMLTVKEIKQLKTDFIKVITSHSTHINISY